MANKQIAKEEVENETKKVSEPIVEVEQKAIPETKPKEEAVVIESDEIQFLRRLYRIQNDGAFGTHLNKEINDRIEFLNKK